MHAGARKLGPLAVGCNSQHQRGERGECEGDTDEAALEELHAPHLQSCGRDWTGSNRAASGRPTEKGAPSSGGILRIAETRRNSRSCRVCRYRRNFLGKSRERLGAAQCETRPDPADVWPLAAPRLERRDLAASAPLPAGDDLPVPATMERAVRARVIAAQPGVTGVSGADPLGAEGADGRVRTGGSALRALLPVRDRHG
jgi:hypothetical protein